MTAPRTVQQLFDLTGKTALITGGSRGLGLQIAEALGLSRIKVIRMLAAARSEGLVKIRIDARSARQAGLERGLVTAFGLKEAVVVPAALAAVAAAASSSPAS